MSEYGKILCKLKASFAMSWGLIFAVIKMWFYGTTIDQTIAIIKPELPYEFDYYTEQFTVTTRISCTISDKLIIPLM